MISTYTPLAHRIDNAIEVTLLRNDDTGEQKVSVRDKLSGTCFELDPGHEHAVQAYRHPYAFRGMSLALSRTA